MVKKTIATFEVPYLQVLDETGKVDAKLMPNIAPEVIRKMYQWMVLTRTFDDKALKLQRQGRMGTYAPVRGQEAAQIGSAVCITKEDLVFPAFRETGVYLVRGMPPEYIFKYWAGDERGMAIPKEVNLFPISITVGAHPPHAVGAAMAFTILKKKSVAITYFGDGATSEGDFHTSMNFAGAFNAPTVFICQNNQWAISLPVKEQTASQTLAQKAIAYGFEGIQVDGNDVFAVYAATQHALNKARAGKGPTFIECLTYRMGDHTTSDDAKKYRAEKLVKEWEQKDPIMRLEKYMLSKKLLTLPEKKKIWDNAQKKIEEDALRMETWEAYPPEDIFNYMYAELTPLLQEQQEEIKREVSPMKEKVKKEGAKSEAMEKGMGVVGELEEA